MNNQPTMPMQNVRVLVLDDEEPIRRVAQTLLTRAGCIVETASDGREGLQILLQRDFDVAVVDLRMTDIGGSTFLEEARSIWPWIGLVILTGHADEESIEHAHRFGVTRILQKPLERDVLNEAVIAEAALKRQKLEMTASHSLDRIQDQLALLRRFSEIAMAAENLDEAITNLSLGIGNLLPCSLVAIMTVDTDTRVIYLNPVQPVSQSFMDAVEQTVIERYRHLTKPETPTDHIAVPLGQPATHEEASSQVHRSYTVPIITEGEVRGLLTLAMSEKDSSHALDISFLYHAGNHLSTILAALTRMRQLSVRDALTGLFNRRGLQEEYEKTWLLSRRYGFPTGVAVIDVDNFKTLNDTYGHPVGDQILMEFAELVKRVARSTDIIGRYGGDEMVVILPQAGDADVLAFGERLVSAVRKRVFLEHSKGLKLTTSIGVASNSSQLSTNVSSLELLSQADQALYHAKKKGRDQVCIHQAHAVESPKATQPGEVKKDSRTRARVLVVDDEEPVAQVIARVLQSRNFEVAVETSAASALARLKMKPGFFDVVITDISMPEITGLELLDQLRIIDDAIIKIVVTGHATLDNALTSLRRGAYDFIQKPVQPSQLLAVLDRALEYARLKAENRRYQLHLEDMVREKSAALRHALDEIKQSYDFTLEALVAMLDAREKNTGQHSVRVRRLAEVLAREMGLSETDVSDISRGALLHDIGKIAIPDAILLKPGALTDEERNVMRSHPEIGHRILTSSRYLERPAEIVLQHQEKFDGSGYPQGLKGHEICLGARIFAVVDAYDAMRSDRPYRKSLSPAVATAEIKRHRGTQFDPAVVEAFVRCQGTFEQIGGWSGSTPTVVEPGDTLRG